MAEFKKSEINQITYFYIDILKELGVKHLITTKLSGFSPYPSNNMNLGINTSDSIENVKKNYELISKTFNFDLSKTILSNQVHGDEILIVDDSYTDDNFLNNTKVKNIDALITNKKNITLVTLYADCVPIILYDSKLKVCALVHSGWKGTVKKIVSKTIKKMSLNFNSNPIDIIAAIGPSISKDCFEVSEDTADLFNDNFKDNRSIVFYEDNKFKVDLCEANKDLLLQEGLLNENIILSNLCTFSNPDIFYSYRKNNDTGRMAAIISL